MSMHPDWAKECLERHRNNRFANKPADLACIISLINEDELIRLCAASENDDIRSIVGRTRKTMLMQEKLADWLLIQYGSAQAVLAAAFETTEEEMFGSISLRTHTPKLNQTVDNELAEKRKKHAETAAAEAHFMGLPVLKGTEKQVQWAESIRKAFLGTNGTIPDPNGPDIIHPGNDLFNAIWGGDDLVEVLQSKAAAKASFWIDNRAYVEMPREIKAVKKQLKNSDIEKSGINNTCAKRIVASWGLPDGIPIRLEHVAEVYELILTSRAYPKIWANIMAQIGRMLPSDIGTLEKNRQREDSGAPFSGLKIHKNADLTGLIERYKGQCCLYTPEMLRSVIDEFINSKFL